MTQAKPKSIYHKDTTILTALIDELLQNCPEQPTQEDLFGPDGVVKQLSKALIERGVAISEEGEFSLESSPGTLENKSSRSGGAATKRTGRTVLLSRG